MKLTIPVCPIRKSLGRNGRLRVLNLSKELEREEEKDGVRIEARE